MPTVIIGGGVGPMAGVALHRSIIEQTATDGRDQSHLPVVHLSFSPVIPDRTEYLLGRETRHPGVAMNAVVAQAVRALPPNAEPIVLGVPCNTFHAPPILTPFLDALSRDAPSIHFVDMIARTIDELRSDSTPRSTPIGVMSTTGTRQTGLWERALQRAGFSVLQIPPERQDELHNAIYDVEWGLKAVSPPHPRAVACVSEFAASLAAAGAQRIVLACTELPLVLPALRSTVTTATFIDPVAALARGLVRAAGAVLR